MWWWVITVLVEDVSVNLMSVEIIVDADRAEPIVLTGAPEKATSNRRRSVITSRKRRGHGGDHHVGDDAHQK